MIPVPPDHRCGLCGDVKHPVNYSAAESPDHAHTWRTVRLCTRCDRTPEAPQRRPAEYGDAR